MNAIFEYPPAYLVSIIVTFCLVAEAIIRRGLVWRIPYLVVLATIGIWYLIEPIYFYDQYSLFPPNDISEAFLAVSIFLLAFRFFISSFAPRGVSGAQRALTSPQRGAEKTLIVCVAAWSILVAVGASRMGGGVLEALFPNGRTAGSMWSRGRISLGAGDSVIAAAGYVYILLLASFGVLAVFVRKTWARVLCFSAMLVSWPYSFLLGARNTALATIGPGFLAFLIYGRARTWVKTALAVGVCFLVEHVFLYVVAYRDVGFFNPARSVDISEAKHAGLNMASELTYIVRFVRDGTLELQWGAGYLHEFTQLIPRSIWPDKPYSALDYAVARGFADASGSEAGVFATVSQGMIGQGVRQFGIFAGPVVVAALMAQWSRILILQRANGSLPHLALYLLGLGLTFNLGRDVTLLVLWPFVLGYACIWGFERFFAGETHRTRAPGRLARRKRHSPDQVSAHQDASRLR